MGPDFEKPEAPLSSTWNEATSERVSTDSTESKTWWLVFKEPVLNELVSLAYRQNLPLQIAGLRILEARAQLGIAVGGQYPQSQQAFGDAIYIENSENLGNIPPGFDTTFTNYSLGFDAAWELDFWGKFRRGIESADASFLASIADYDDVLVSLTSEVARAYATMRTFEERLAISRENVDIQEQSVNIAGCALQVRLHDGTGHQAGTDAAVLHPGDGTGPTGKHPPKPGTPLVYCWALPRTRWMPLSAVRAPSPRCRRKSPSASPPNCCAGGRIYGRPNWRRWRRAP